MTFIISNCLVQSLDDEILRILVESITDQHFIVKENVKKSLNLEITIRVIKSALKNMNKKNNSFSKMNKYEILKLVNRVITNVLR